MLVKKSYGLDNLSEISRSGIEGVQLCHTSNKDILI